MPISAETLKRALELVKSDRKIQAGAASLVIASASLISMISKHEGTETKPYKDVVGVLTVCNGHTGPDIIPGKTYSKQECDALLKKDISVHSEGLLKCTNVPLNQNQYDAFVSFTFNVGVGAYCKSTLVKKLNAGDYVGACNELSKWDKSGGKVYRGLTKRREEERKLCLTPVS